MADAAPHRDPDHLAGGAVGRPPSGLGMDFAVAYIDRAVPYALPNAPQTPFAYGYTDTVFAIRADRPAQDPGRLKRRGRKAARWPEVPLRDSYR